MTFRKGEIGNLAEITARRAARQQSVPAIATLAGICADPDVKPRARAIAAVALLNHGYGRPRKPPSKADGRHPAGH